MNTQTQMNYIDSAKRVIEIETQAIANLADRLDSEFIAACHILFACKGKVVVSGVMKLIGLPSGLLNRVLS